VENTLTGGADALTVIVQADTAIVVGSAEAAKRLNTSEDRVRQFVRAGLIATVPHLSTDAKLAIAVSELERFAAQGTVLRAVAS
jgi:chromosomal replication initiation ATPase DnaA